MHQHTAVVQMMTLVAAGIGLAAPVPAATSSDRSAAIVVFPYVTRDASRGVDTEIRLSNTDGHDPVDVACFLEDTTVRCTLNPEQPCLDNAGCPAGDACAQLHLEITQFRLRLTAAQPISWRISAGLAQLPPPASGGPIPAAPVEPFGGVLRCVAVDPDGIATDRNVLQGEAVLGRYDAAAGALDVASYNAVGVAALAGATPTDGHLVLGGSAANYEPCPAALTLNHFFDLGVDPVTHASQFLTTLAIVPCSADLSVAMPNSASDVVQYFVFNEFEQRFSTSRPMQDQRVGVLSETDTQIRERSIFSAGITGTLSGQTRLNGIIGGLLGVAVEGHVTIDDPDRFASAAFNLHTDGERETSDTVVIAGAPLAFGCGKQPAVGCKRAASSRLWISEGRRRPGPRLVWEWRQGEATSMRDLGDPRRGTDYALCLYSGTAAAASTELLIPSSQCWAAVRRGFTYSDPSCAADGVVKIALQASTRARARALLRARGANLPRLGGASGMTLPVVVQLVNSQAGMCFESVFDSQDVVRNKPGIFEARAVDR